MVGPKPSTTAVKVVVVVVMVRRRWRAAVWFQLLRSYLSQCGTAHIGDHRLSIDGNRDRRRKRQEIVVGKGCGGSPGASSCSEAGPGCLLADPAEGGGRYRSEAWAASDSVVKEVKRQKISRPGPVI